MWFMDFREHDPDSNYPEPSAKQIIYAEQARREAERLRSTLERLTVPQQREIIATLPSGVFRPTLDYDPSGARRGLGHDGP